jgi:sulfotransferase 6B1
MNTGQISFLPKVLVNSLPKSGTHLILQIILGIPGMIITPSWIIEDKDLEMIKPGSVGPAHLIYSTERLILLKQKKVKVIYISRDLRDVVVSLVHFVMLNKWGNHPWTPYLKDLKTHDERLLAMIKGVNLSKGEQIKYGIEHIPNIKEFANNKLGWIQKPGICSLTFEELVSNDKLQNESIMKIINFLWTDLEHLRMTKLELLERIKQNIVPESSGTFRKGKVGDWKEEFNIKHKEAFKEIAGDLLIQLGYEKDYNW